MSNIKVKNEFYVMKAFVEALPQMDANALAALLTWLEARGNDELVKRKAAQPPIAPE